MYVILWFMYHVILYHAEPWFLNRSRNTCPNMLRYYTITMSPAPLVLWHLCLQEFFNSEIVKQGISTSGWFQEDTVQSVTNHISKTVEENDLDEFFTASTIEEQREHFQKISTGLEKMIKLAMRADLCYSNANSVGSLRWRLAITIQPNYFSWFQVRQDLAIIDTLNSQLGPGLFKKHLTLLSALVLNIEVCKFVLSS